METFSDERLIGGFYVLQYLLQHSLYSDKTTEFGQYHLQQYQNLINQLQARNFKIQKNETNTSTSDFFDFSKIKIFQIVINKNGETICPTNQVDEIAIKMIRFLEAYSTDSFLN
ncbi:hypothetical protein [Sulfurospirillum multivorans]|uniref:Uncharacterized protein n=2 Tax=Sulfurospirillum multivorans TaxID=66821 RepID=A0AA86APC2_SULMK|nr:hypothetical protein [Sulfurospirillum multivorans]AHJ13121.1 hypothetical protein SMUL_1866 [Sulfurospirillum multivorans DSM 12446]QEH06609.1 hypothetical protein SMN_1844 [Sulfurospirillum multivorans]